MKNKSQQGFSVIELLVALIIGLAILAAALAFLNNTSTGIRMGQENSRNTSVAQQALGKMVREIKGVHIENPPLLSVTPVWNTLPALPYTALELYPYPVTAGSVSMPAMPAARKFASQSGATDIYHKWYPNPTGSESNSLVFYKAQRTLPGGNSTIERITYRLNGSRLIREVQQPLTSGSSSFVTSPVPQASVLADQVLSIQFIYPDFMRQMSAAVDTVLTQVQVNDGNTALQERISRDYRKVIGIRIIMAGARIKNAIQPGVELQTEVRLRSE